MGSVQRIKEVAGLVSGAGKNIVVLSAMSGTTNALVEIAGYYNNRNPEGAREMISRLESQYMSRIAGLYETAEAAEKATEYVRGVFSTISSFGRDIFTPALEKVILAQGELISSFLMATYMEEKGISVALMPALSFMRTDRQGEPDLEYLRGKIREEMASWPDASLYITQGYICMNASDEVDNLGRGGSDYTACLIGAAVQAEEIQIWTDIDGMHDNDPRYVEDTSAVRHLHFDEAAELAYFGAKILHPTCIQPARFANVPVRILNTMDPSAPGTLIDNALDRGSIKAVAAKDSIAAIKIKSSRMLLAHGFLRKVFEIFESYCTPIDMICTSEVGVSMSIDDTRYLNEIVHDLKKYGTVSVDLDMCIICVAGDMDWTNVGFESRVMEALKGIPVRMVSYGGSNYNISILVRQEDKALALRELSRKLFRQ